MIYSVKVMEEEAAKDYIVSAKDKETALWKVFMETFESIDAVNEAYPDARIEFSQNVDMFGKFYSDKLSMVPKDVLRAMAGDIDWCECNYIARRFIVYVVWRELADIKPLVDRATIVM